MHISELVAPLLKDFKLDKSLKYRHFMDLFFPQNLTFLAKSGNFAGLNRVHFLVLGKASINNH